LHARKLRPEGRKGFSKKFAVRLAEVRKNTCPDFKGSAIVFDIEFCSHVCYPGMKPGPGI
jgi:hypothetical protein